MIRYITTGAICGELGCFGSPLDKRWIVISGFLFIMWAVTLILFLKERRKNVSNKRK